MERKLKTKLRKTYIFTDNTRFLNSQKIGEKIREGKNKLSEKASE
jgi:hypothetical protein